MAKREFNIENGFADVRGWMTRILVGGRPINLPEVVIYAIIYGFSCDSKSVFRGGRRYLSDFLHLSLPTVDKHLDTLVDAHLITRHCIEERGVTFHNYSVDFTSVQDFLPAIKNSIPCGKNVLGDTLCIERRNLEREERGATADAVAHTPASSSSSDMEGAEGITSTPHSAAPSPKRRAENAAKNVFDFVGALMADGVTEQTAKDWTTTRRQKGAKNSSTAYYSSQGVHEQIMSAAQNGVSAEDLISYAEYRGWCACDYAWYEREHVNRRPFNTAPISADASQRCDMIDISKI